MTERAESGAPVSPPPRDDSKVTRFEVIDHRTGALPFGRVFSAWDCHIELAYQDNRRTLKVFVDGVAPEPPTPMPDAERAKKLAAIRADRLGVRAAPVAGHSDAREEVRPQGHGEAFVRQSPGTGGNEPSAAPPKTVCMDGDCLDNAAALNAADEIIAHMKWCRWCSEDDPRECRHIGEAYKEWEARAGVSCAAPPEEQTP